MKYIQQLKSKYGEIVKADVDTKNLVTFRAGGVAQCVITPSHTYEIIDIIHVLKENSIKFMVIGNGSNILIKDEGYDGCIIKIANKIGDITIDDNIITAQSGCMIAKLSRVAKDNELANAEFMCGIPGTLGGALYMNAGAYGGEMKDIVKEVTAYHINSDEVIKLTNEQCLFGYRESVFGNDKYIILECVIKLEKGDKQLIQNQIDENMYNRNSKQPVELPSAGSTFKRPPNAFAGKLIMDAGLSGFRIGDAVVSPKHCGFVVNVGDATATDIINVINHVQEVVYDKFGVKLETEVKIF